ncbi:MAG: hypothetical protein JWO46_3400 [Nocardioidaceae bacterium]|nr:hypothetical protein [Nocardioidaceae bacterium]
MSPADLTQRSEDRTVLRAVAAGLAAAYVVALGLPWTNPPYSKAPFSGYAMFGSWFGDLEDSVVCGEKSCRKSEALVAGTLPPLAVMLLVLVLLSIALGVTRLRCRLATALTVLVVLGLVAELLWMGQAASNAGSRDTVVLGGMLVTLFLSFVSFVVTIRLADLVRTGPTD